MDNCQATGQAEIASIRHSLPVLHDLAPTRSDIYSSRSRELIFDFRHITPRLETVKSVEADRNMAAGVAKAGGTDSYRRHDCCTGASPLGR